jgi:transposase
VEYKFKGKRIKRGLYKTQKGKIINADVNAAANIIRKSKHESDYE